MEEGEFDWRVNKVLDQRQQQNPEVKEVLPSYIPRFRCSNGACHQIHPNENFSDYPRGKCENCSQFSKHDHGTCSWCGKKDIEPVDRDDLDDIINFKEEGSGWW